MEKKFFKPWTKALGMRLEKTEPNKKGELWKVAIIAIVREIHGSSSFDAPNVKVQFYLNGYREGEPEETDGEGRAVKNFEIEKGTHTIEVVASKDSLKARNKITIALKSDEEEKKPAKIVVETSGSNGNYNILVWVRTEKDKPVNGTLVYFIEDDGKEEWLTKTTDEDGMCLHSIKFTDNLRVYKITTGNSPEATRKTVRLTGPVTE